MLAVFERLAMAAGAAIMAIRQGGINARYKLDHSPVTEADEQAEKIIIDGLAIHFPDIQIVAEESVCAGIVPAKLDTRFFLVDALDGTKEFVSGREDFTVNIALIEHGAPIAGVVYAPARNVLYSGAGSAASKLQTSDPEHRRTPIQRQAPSGIPRVVASRSHMTAETEQWLGCLPGCKTVNVGSSLKFCLLAEGSADVYPRLSRTMEWDTAAGDAVLRAAGGMTETLDGKPLQYGKRNQPTDTDFANPHFVARI